MPELFRLVPTGTVTLDIKTPCNSVNLGMGRYKVMVDGNIPSKQYGFLSIWRKLPGNSIELFGNFSF
jgi:hypothetical protein